MGWVEPVSTAVKAASLANSLQSSKRIRSYSSRIGFWLKNGSAKIPIFGAGGVGKTTVAKVITSDNPLDLSAPYDESWLIEPIDLQGPIPGQLLIAPGQIERVERHWPTLLSKVGEGECFGLINVVSWGYHSFAIRSITEHTLYQPGTSAIEFMEVYATARRQVEMDLLLRIADGLVNLNHPIWMLTIVNKQDLWWDQRQAVRQHYEQAEYNQIVRKLTSTIGERNFQHEYIPASLTLGNFQTLSGELLRPTVSGYDQGIHLQYLQVLFDKLYTLIGQGQPQ
ncbi:MAG: hypothetical protein WA902_24145 [Thermosynechococcaceae cyanobacterium]